MTGLLHTDIHMCKTINVTHYIKPWSLCRDKKRFLSSLIRKPYRE